MEQNVSNYYKQKRNKKKKFRIVLILMITLIFIPIIFFCCREKEIDTSRINENINNNDNEKVIDSKDDVNNESDISDIDPKENWKVADSDYFKDAVFIGDSRTEGFILNNGLTAKITSFTYKGLTVNTIFSDKVININGEKLTIIDALKETDFSKVYIMLGINEIGWVYSDIFIDKYSEIIDEIKNINPESIIYIQSIIPVTEKVSNEHPYIRNSKIEEYNVLLKKLAEEKNVYYLNVQDALINENNVLPDDAATDGIHLNKKYCVKWLEYLKEHTK